MNSIKYKLIKVKHHTLWKESWLSDEINSAEGFRDDYITFRRDRCSRGGGVFNCVKICIDCRELWTDEDFEMVAVEVKGTNPKFIWEVVGIYRAPKEDMRVIERLATRTDSTVTNFIFCIHVK